MAKHKGGHKVKAPHHKLSSHAPALGKDSMAHEAHHAANKEHGMEGGFEGGEQYEDGGTDHHLGDNCCMED